VRNASAIHRITCGITLENQFMASEKSTKQKAKKVAIDVEPDIDKSAGKAEKVLRPTVQAAFTLSEYGKPFGDLDIVDLVDSLAEQTTAVIDGDLGRGEAMLTAQAHTLDSIFNSLAQRAISSRYLDHLDRYLKLALKAQSQSRATWDAISNIQNPRVQYVKQMNLANNQQVNNASRTEKTNNEPNQLSGESNELYTNTGTQRIEKKDGLPLEALGEVHRAEVSRG